MDEQWKQSLRRAVKQLPAPDVQALWELPVTQMTVHDYITQQETPPPTRKPPRRSWRLATTAVCVLLSVAGSLLWYREKLAVHAIVDLDVNPSIELKVNRQEEVLSVNALNAEAALLLEGFSGRGQELDDAVEALTERLLAAGYLQPSENAVLLTVSGQDADEMDDWAQDLSETIRQTADRAETPTTVLRQTARIDPQLSAQAKEYHVSSGKLRLAAALGDRLPQYTLAQLLELPMETLLEAARQQPLGEETGIAVDATLYPPAAVSPPPVADANITAPTTPPPTPVPAQTQTDDDWDEDSREDDHDEEPDDDDHDASDDHNRSGHDAYDHDA